MEATALLCPRPSYALVAVVSSVTSTSMPPLPHFGFLLLPSGSSSPSPPALALPWLAISSLKQELCKHSGDVVQANQVLCPRGVPCPVRLLFRLLAASLFLPASLLSLARSLITPAPMTKVLISHGFVVPFLSHFTSSSFLFNHKS